MQAGPTLKPSEDTPASEWITEWAQTEDGAGGGQAEEQTCARGRGMRLLKIGESRTQMRRRDGNVRMGTGEQGFEFQTEPIRENHPRG